MFPSALDSTPVGTIDELEVDRLPNGGGASGDDHTYPYADDDDGTEFSQPTTSLSPTGGGGGAGGTIRMEGWLCHAASSHKNAAHGAANPAAPGAAPPPPSSSSSSIYKTVSKKKRHSKKKQPRYFVLRGSALSCYSRRHDVKAKGTFVLTAGCAVGPVLYGSLDDPVSSMEVANAHADNQQQQLLSPESEFPGSPSASAHGAHSAALATATEHASSNHKFKKKKRQYYCVQVTWPVDNKPSKDEKEMAQAKAQVAAESEKEALQQKQQVEHESESFEDSGSVTQMNGGNRSPTILRPKLTRRSRSESAKEYTKSPRRRRSHEGLPPDLHPPNLTGEDDDEHDHASDNGHSQSLPLRPVSLLPSKNSSLNTPASAMAGMNAFHHPESHPDPNNNNNDPNNANANHSALNHETGLHKHYTQQLEKSRKDQQKSAEELQKVMLLLSRKKSHQKTKKRVIQGTKVAAVSTAAITAGVLTAGIGLAAGLVFVGIAGAAGGSGAVVGSKMLDKAMGKYQRNQSQKSFHLVIAAETYEEALKWKVAMESVVRELVEDTNDGMPLEILVAEQVVGEKAVRGSRVVAVGDAVAAATASAPSSPNKKSMGTIMKGSSTPIPNTNATGGNVHANEMTAYHAGMAPKWVPIQGGGMALWGILGALGGGGGNLRIYREERTPCHSLYSPLLFTQPAPSPFPTIPRFKSDVGLAGQPFPPFKASVALKGNSLDAFMCLMCSGRIHNDEDGGVGNRTGDLGDGSSRPIPVPNSGQIASFRIIETMDEHMDVIHLVFRPLYLFPSWTAPRDFVLYRFWKYDDDGTYQVCFDSGEHRDCPKVPGYVRGEMHSVYTIAPLKRKKKRGATTSSSSSGTTGQEECLLSHVVQIDPRGWVPSTSSVPFFRNQGYGDAFAVMALHQMLDVKEALDSARFVAVPMDSVSHHSSNYYSSGQGERKAKMSRTLLAGGSKGNGTSSNGLPVRPPKGIIRDSSSGSARGRANGVSQQQQLYVPILETAGSGYASEEEEPDTATYDFKYSGRESFSSAGYHQLSDLTNSASGYVQIDGVNEEWQRRNPDSNKVGNTAFSNIMRLPSPMINQWWAEPDANSFRVRGKNYKVDSKKVNAGSSLFRLLATDIVETDVPIMTGMCLHPKERVQLALQREAEAKSKGVPSPTEMPPFVFAVNIALPGPPNYHMLFYYAVDDMSLIDGSDGTPSSKLCQEFFFGKDDTFRDNTFKLIPQIIEGNFMVRKAVGSTPAIMGNKIKQTYVQGERFFELMIDTGSSAVAAGVIRICNGYAKMIVVDLAFLFEGYNEQTLPERVLGCVRLKNVEFGKKLRFVESVDD